MTGKKATMTLNLPQSEMDALSARARETGMTKTTIVRQALADDRAARADRPAAEVGKDDNLREALTEALRLLSSYGECCLGADAKDDAALLATGLCDVERVLSAALAPAATRPTSPDAGEVREAVSSALHAVGYFGDELNWLTTTVVSALALIPARDAAAAESAREAAAKVADVWAKTIVKGGPEGRVDMLAAGMRASAEQIAEAIRALPVADLLRPEGAQSEPKPVSRSGDPELDELLAQAEARYAAMTPAERVEQDRRPRESWARGQIAVGSDRDEAKDRAALREGAQAEGETSRG